MLASDRSTSRKPSCGRSFIGPRRPQLFRTGFPDAWSTARAAPQDNPASGGYLRTVIERLFLGFITNFFDTLGIGSFATTTAACRARRLVSDELIPGTLNVGHALPTIAQAIIYITVIDVDKATLVLQALRMEYPGGDTRLMEFSDVRINPPVAADAFAIAALR